MNFSPFAEQGLAGLVIGALFTILVFVLRNANIRDEKLDMQFKESIRRINDDAREERTLTADRNERLYIKLADAIENLAQSIHMRSQNDQ